MAKKHINQNYIHDCDGEKVKISDYIHSIYEMNFSSDEIKSILEFYLFKPPVLKNTKEKDKFGLTSLKNYGWVGNADIRKLEGKLLKSAHVGNFIFLESSTINDTLESMNLEEKMCVEHPRCVIKWNTEIALREDGSFEKKNNETRMECLFRHIRNSFAHNHLYCFENGNIMLEDVDENGKVSARILIPKHALLEWMKIVKKEVDKI